MDRAGSSEFATEAEVVTFIRRMQQAAVEVEALDGLLQVSVRNDGVGGADFARGSGLVGLKDRVEALGGRVLLVSPRAKGTSVEVELPLT
jgi:signal transduction histidine kinase